MSNFPDRRRAVAPLCFRGTGVKAQFRPSFGRSYDFFPLIFALSYLTQYHFLLLSYLQVQVIFCAYHEPRLELR